MVPNVVPVLETVESVVRLVVVMIVRSVEVEVSVLHGMIVNVTLVVQRGGRVFEVADVVVVMPVLVVTNVIVAVLVFTTVLVNVIGGTEGYRYA